MAHGRHDKKKPLGLLSVKAFLCLDKIPLEMPVKANECHMNSSQEALASRRPMHQDGAFNSELLSLRIIIYLDG